MNKENAIELDFSCKYDAAHALNYFHKHQDGLARRLSHRRDAQMARKALKMAGNPETVLDLPCGAGRFWPVLAEHKSRKILAADNSADMIHTALNCQPAHIVSRVEAFQTSAFDIDLNDQAVDCIFSMRLMHHIEKPEHRLAMLNEFHRVSRDTVILSLWVDGNFKARRRARLEKKRAAQGKNPNNRNRLVIPRATIETEFRHAGFEIIGKQDFLTGYSMWRVYTLQKQC